MTGNVITYIGNSMLPTLLRGDILKVVQYSHRKIHVGDVIAFQTPKGGALIVHRVVSVNLNGVRTKGDNNFRIDGWVLSPDDILGRIVSVNRGGKNTIILSGFLGQKYAIALRNLKRIYNALLSFVLSRAYHWFSDKGSFNKLFINQVNIRLGCFKHGDSLELQLLFDRRVIGRLLPGQKQWYIRRPFRFVLDEKSLPMDDIFDHLLAQHFFS
jgi:signal peptidase I